MVYISTHVKCDSLYYSNRQHYLCQALVFCHAPSRGDLFCELVTILEPIEGTATNQAVFLMRHDKHKRDNTMTTLELEPQTLQPPSLPRLELDDVVLDIEREAVRALGSNSPLESIDQAAAAIAVAISTGRLETGSIAADRRVIELSILAGRSISDVVTVV